MITIICVADCTKISPLLLLLFLFIVDTRVRFSNGRIKHHPTHFWIKLSALLNIAAGAAYIWWRAARSMPDDPVRWDYFFYCFFFQK